MKQAGNWLVCLKSSLLIRLLEYILDSSRYCIVMFIYNLKTHTYIHACVSTLDLLLIILKCWGQARNGMIQSYFYIVLFKTVDSNSVLSVCLTQQLKAVVTRDIKIFHPRAVRKLPEKGKGRLKYHIEKGEIIWWYPLVVFFQRNWAVKMGVHLDEAEIVQAKENAVLKPLAYLGRSPQNWYYQHCNIYLECVFKGSNPYIIFKKIFFKASWFIKIPKDQWKEALKVLLKEHGKKGNCHNERSCKVHINMPTASDKRYHYQATSIFCRAADGFQRTCSIWTEKCSLTYFVALLCESFPKDVLFQTTLCICLFRKHITCEGVANTHVHMQVLK